MPKKDCVNKRTQIVCYHVPPKEPWHWLRHKSVARKRIHHIVAVALRATDPNHSTIADMTKSRESMTVRMKNMTATVEENQRIIRIVQQAIAGIGTRKVRRAKICMIDLRIIRAVHVIGITSEVKVFVAVVAAAGVLVVPMIILNVKIGMKVHQNGPTVENRLRNMSDAGRANIRHIQAVVIIPIDQNHHLNSRRLVGQ